MIDFFLLIILKIEIKLENKILDNNIKNYSSDINRNIDTIYLISLKQSDRNSYLAIVYYFQN